MADLKLKIGTIQNTKDPIYKKGENGTLYFVKDNRENDDDRTYIYLNGNNIIPYLLDVRNGGLGADLSGAATNSVYIKESGNATTTVSSKKGAFYSTGTDIRPQFNTLPVDVGGTGKTSITAGAIIYGAGTGALKELKAGTNGHILVSSGSAPIYVKPEMTWTDGNENGPVFNFKFNGQTFTGVAIPAASLTTSGIITNSAQTISGSKTFNSITYTSHIYPKTTKASNLGYWTSQTNHGLWSGIYTRYLFMANNNGYKAAQLSVGDSETLAGLSLGNDLAKDATGSVRGALWIYGQDTGYASISYVSSENSRDYVFPSPKNDNVHYITPSKTEDYNVSTGTTFHIPFYAALGEEMALACNDGLSVYHKDGDTSTTQSGQATLVIGNSLATGTLHNKRGKLTLYGSQSGRTHLHSNDANGTSELNISLPAASGELVYHTEDAAQGGQGRLISVTADGQVVADTSTNIGTAGNVLMYLNAGKLTASTASKGSNTKLIYLSSGAITESTGNVANDGITLMNLTSGTLTASNKDIAGNTTIMYLSKGKLTASKANVANTGVRLMNLTNGVLTASSSNVADNGKTLMYLKTGTLTASQITVGGESEPVYLNAGVITKAKAYSTILESVGVSGNTLTVTAAGTSKTASVVTGVTTEWTTASATSVPAVKVTVNGVSDSAVAPAATYNRAGVVTTAAQYFGGVKTFTSGLKIAASATTSDCATFSYDASTDTLTISFP